MIPSVKHPHPRGTRQTYQYVSDDVLLLPSQAEHHFDLLEMPFAEIGHHFQSSLLNGQPSYLGTIRNSKHETYIDISWHLLQNDDINLLLGYIS